MRAIPESSRHRDGIVVEALECRDITHRRVDAPFHLQAPDADVEQGGQGGELACVRSCQRLNKLRDFGCLDAAVDDDSLDAGLLQPPHQFAHVLRCARHGNLTDDEIVADDADGE